MADCVNKRRVARLKVITESWREHCNKVRPHSSLGYRSPAPEVLVPASKLILRATLN
jgi:transposase InsO family protein